MRLEEANMLRRVRRNKVRDFDIRDLILMLLKRRGIDVVKVGSGF